MSQLLLAEELLLLALDDAKGTPSGSVAVDPGLAGALLLDLIASGSLIETSDGLEVDRVGSPPSHPLLVEAQNVVGANEKRRSAKHWVDKLPRELKPIKGRVAASLVSRGALVEERHKTLGFIASTRYPQADPGPERELRARLQAALLLPGEKDPDPRTARLVVLVHALGLVAAVVPKDQRGAAKARAKAIADSNAVGSAVKRAVEEIQAAVTVAVMGGVISSTGTS